MGAESDLVGFGDGPDLLHHEVPELLLHVAPRRDAGLQGDERYDPLPLDFVGFADDRSLFVPEQPFCRGIE